MFDESSLLCSPAAAGFSIEWKVFRLPSGVFVRCLVPVPLVIVVTWRLSGERDATLKGECRSGLLWVKTFAVVAMDCYWDAASFMAYSCITRCSCCSSFLFIKSLSLNWSSELSRRKVWFSCSRDSLSSHVTLSAAIVRTLILSPCT